MHTNKCDNKQQTKTFKKINTAEQQTNSPYHRFANDDEQAHTRHLHKKGDGPNGVREGNGAKEGVWETRRDR